MSPEGELRVGLRLRAGTIERVGLASTRPAVARSLLQGRSRVEVQAALPVLFSLCGRSQAMAGRLACAAAAGEPLQALMTEGLAGVAAETVRELACHTLLHWPRWLGEEPDALALAAVRDAMAWTPSAAAAPAAQAIALTIFGQPAAEWLQLRSEPALRRWAAQARTPPARFVRHAFDAAAPAAGGAAGIAWLPRPDAAWLADVAAALSADPGFARAPVHRGMPAETGSLARLQSDPTFVLGRLGAERRPVARFVARLHELALLLDGRMPLGTGALSLGDDAAIAWVDNARGLLLHRVRLAQGRVDAYDIVAPTEWNFHPQGPLAAALRGTRAGSDDEALALARQVVHSLDPCVVCRVGVDDA